ncbi:Tuberous sclerosis 1 [Sphaceloma murrayae]|uniref:Tuberous sclerosis 1 n=1 Tax=Sphaceloma murrayae TaxID=2082308 RepID=A0A2K1QUV3_9PEZI|nr:Tuberous sclerosis 1 [Sphaceloma murrayae]
MSGSSSDTVSLLSKTFAQPEISNDALTTLLQALEQFVGKHCDPEETQSAKVQDELRRLYNDYGDRDAAKLEAVVASLAVLEPYLRTTGDLQSWFELAITTVVEIQDNKRSFVQHTKDFVLVCASYDKDATGAAERALACQKMAHRLIEEYLKRTQALRKGDASMSARLQNRTQQSLQDMIVELGRRHPEPVFRALETSLTPPSSRFHTLQLLCAWLKYQHAHLDAVVNTDVIVILLKCLMNDRSTVMVSVGLQCLLMLLPHIPATVVSQLPRLFLIYSRCLCWEKFSATSSKAQRDLVTDDRLVNGSDDELEDLFTIDPTWAVVTSVPDAPEAAAPELLTYFTYLYGLYPINFMSYVRKPRRYLKQINFPGAENFDLDRNVIRKRTEQFQRAHLLHPSFFNTTAEEELTDGRWLKAEPSEVVAECLGLYSGMQAIPQSPGPAPSCKLPALPDSPTISARPAPLSPTRMVSSTSTTDPLSPSLSTAGLTGSIESLTKVSPVLSGDASFLQRELLVMRNELNFERYLKQQHVVAIGQLKRERIKAVTVEAETSTLYNANKRLQRKLEEASKFNEKLQKETQSRKTHARQSEDQLNAKIRALRSGLADQAALEHSLKKANGDIEILRELLSTSEARETRAQDKLGQQTEQLKELESLRTEVAALQQQIQGYRSVESDAGDARAELEMFKRDLELTKRMLDSRDQERERLKKSFQTKIAELEARDPASNSNGIPDQDLHHSLDEALSKITSIQRAWTETTQELQQMKLKYNDLLAATSFSRPVDGQVAQDHLLWQGPPVGATYLPTDYVRAMPVPISGTGHPRRPPRPDAFDARPQNYSPLSRSEGSATPAALPTEGGWEISTGSLPGSTMGNGYSVVSGWPSERMRVASSAFSTGSESSSLGKDRIGRGSEGRIFGRGMYRDLSRKEEAMKLTVAGGAQNGKTKTKAGEEKKGGVPQRAG